jgi:hypothetical protein
MAGRFNLADEDTSNGNTNCVVTINGTRQTP